MVGEIDEALELLEVSGPEYGSGRLSLRSKVAITLTRALLAT